jgi:hypothetical protein
MEYSKHIGTAYGLYYLSSKGACQLGFRDSHTGRSIVCYTSNQRIASLVLASMQLSTPIELELADHSADGHRIVSVRVTLGPDHASELDNLTFENDGRFTVWIKHPVGGTWKPVWTADPICQCLFENAACQGRPVEHVLLGGLSNDMVLEAKISVPHAV